MSIEGAFSDCIPSALDAAPTGPPHLQDGITSLHDSGAIPDFLTGPWTTKNPVLLKTLPEPCLVSKTIYIAFFEAEESHTAAAPLNDLNVNLFHRSNLFPLFFCSIAATRHSTRNGTFNSLSMGTKEFTELA